MESTWTPYGVIKVHFFWLGLGIRVRDKAGIYGESKVLYFGLKTSHTDKRDDEASACMISNSCIPDIYEP